MNKNNNLSKLVPPTTHRFAIRVEGDLTSHAFEGEFECRIPTKKDQCFIDKHRAFLNGDLVDQLSPETLKFHHMISYLRFTLTEYPTFWKESDLGYGLYDGNIVEEVYNEVLTFEESWLKDVWGADVVESWKDPKTKKAKKKK